MLTRKKQKELNERLVQQRLTLQNDIQALYKSFERRKKPAPKKRQIKEKRKKRRINQKIKDLHMDRILKLRNDDGLSFRQIGKLMTIHPDTIHKAVTRYTKRGGIHRDERANNGRNNPRHKIGPELQRQLLDRSLLQQWSGLNLEQRCLLIRENFGVSLSLKGLQKFYIRNSVKYLAVGYLYSQSLARGTAAVENFAVRLAKVIAAGTPLVYFDEASFNLWLRNRKTWSPRVEPIKYVLNKNRGKGITVMGAISPHLGKPLFTLESSTNSRAFCQFLGLLRQRFPLKSTRVTIVLDNAKAHKTLDVQRVADELNLELMFMPPYTPEFNCIEALWSVIKRDFKQRVLARREVRISDDTFRQLLQDSLSAIKQNVQKNAARFNNREFMHLTLGKVASRQQDFVEHEVQIDNHLSSEPSLDSVDEEIRMMEERAINEMGTAQNASASPDTPEQELTPLQIQPSLQFPDFMIDLDDYLANGDQNFIFPGQDEDNKDPEL